MGAQVFYRSILLIIISSFLFAIIDPQYNGFLDLRYQKSSQIYKGTGSFGISTLQLEIEFPLNRNYLIFYETQLFNNFAYFEQLYFDIDSFPVPLNLRLGRFRVPFGMEKSRQTDKVFISNSIIRDTRWSTSNYLIPRSENGALIYYHSRAFSSDFYLVNGGGQLFVENNDKAGKSFGADMRFLIKDFLDAGFSFGFNDLSNTSNAGADNQYITAGTDYRFTIGEIDFGLAYVMASGKKDGISNETNGYNLELVWNFMHNLKLGTSLSALNSSGRSDYRGSFVVNYLVNQDLILKSELSYDRINSIDDYILQTQILIKI